MSDPQTINNHRTRINLSQTAKGPYQLEVTAEYDTPEEALKALDAAFEGAKKLCEDKGIPLAS